MSEVIQEGDGDKKVSIMEVQEAVGSLPQVELPVEHFFAAGIYTRVMKIPAGSLAVGKRHRDETINILLKGTLAVYLGEEEEPMIVSAPFIFKSKANVKKVVLAFSDVLLANVHPTEETDLEIIEKEVIVPDDEYEGELEYFSGNLNRFVENVKFITNKEMS